MATIRHSSLLGNTNNLPGVDNLQPWKHTQWMFTPRSTTACPEAPVLTAGPCLPRHKTCLAVLLQLLGRDRIPFVSPGH